MHPQTASKHLAWQHVTPIAYSTLFVPTSIAAAAEGHQDLYVTPKMFTIRFAGKLRWFDYSLIVSNILVIEFVATCLECFPHTSTAPNRATIREKCVCWPACLPAIANSWEDEWTDILLNCREWKREDDCEWKLYCFRSPSHQRLAWEWMFSSEALQHPIDKCREMTWILFPQLSTNGTLVYLSSSPFTVKFQTAAAVFSGYPWATPDVISNPVGEWVAAEGGGEDDWNNSRFLSLPSWEGLKRRKVLVTPDCGWEEQI